MKTDAITLYTRCRFDGADQISSPLRLVVRDAAGTPHEAAYVDGSMAAHGRARYTLAGAVWELKRDGTLVRVEGLRRAA